MDSFASIKDMIKKECEDSKLTIKNIFEIKADLKEEILNSKEITES